MYRLRQIDLFFEVVGDKEYQIASCYGNDIHIITCYYKWIVFLTCFVVICESIFLIIETLGIINLSNRMRHGMGDNPGWWVFKGVNL